MFVIVAAYQMIPALLERSRKTKADRQIAIDRGSDEDWKAWKIVKTEEKLSEILTENLRHFEWVRENQRRKFRAAMTEEEEKAMLQKGEENGIKRLYIDQGGLALRWPEYKKIAEQQADGLPTAKELESAGIS